MSNFQIIPSLVILHTGVCLFTGNALGDGSAAILSRIIEVNLTLILLSCFFNFQPLEVVSHYRDPQPQVVEHDSY